MSVLVGANGREVGGGGGGRVVDTSSPEGRQQQQRTVEHGPETAGLLLVLNIITPTTVYINLVVD